MSSETPYLFLAVVLLPEQTTEQIHHTAYIGVFQQVAQQSRREDFVGMNGIILKIEVIKCRQKAKGGRDLSLILDH